MAYDFSSAINAATAAVNGTKTGEGAKYPYPLVYVPKGQTIVVKLLFNPASGLIARQVRRHDFDGNKVPCYKSYNMECPICKMMESITSTLGQDPFGKSKSKSRGISFAQYMSSTVPIEVGGDGHKTVLKPGDTILFMYPWSVYTQINAIIQAVGQTPTGMERAFCTADDGLFVQVSSTQDFKYTTVLVPYMKYESGLTNDQYLKMLDGMPSLAEQVIPSSITQEVDAQVKEAANTLYSTYINPRVPNQTPAPAVPTMLNNPVPQPQPQVPYQVPQATQTPSYIPNSGLSDDDLPFYTTTPQPQNPPKVVNDKPECFGKHRDGDPTCIVCPYELTCIQAGA